MLRRKGRVKMTGFARHMFPGNNTPQGFFSYYQYILAQEEAEQIYCIKGGPGTGKSTFMKKIAAEMLEEGHDIDFMHCSSDSHSLDGIVIKDKNIAFIDATAPHIVDPVNPGAVDQIIHLGEFWDQAGIRVHKREIMESRAKLSDLFARTYRYLAAAKSMYDNVADIYEKTVAKEAFYQIAADLTTEELAHKAIGQKRGKIKKFFASAMTPEGLKHYLDTLAQPCKTAYIFRAPVGLSVEKTLEIFVESAVYRGLDIELYYCPLDPEKKLEHLVVPALGLAILTSNNYHEIFVEGSVDIHMEAYIDRQGLEQNARHLDNSLSLMDEMLGKGIECLRMAKKEHHHLETYYTPNMDFDAVEKLRTKMLKELKQG